MFIVFFHTGGAPHWYCSSANTSLHRSSVLKPRYVGKQLKLLQKSLPHHPTDNVQKPERDFQHGAAPREHSRSCRRGDKRASPLPCTRLCVQGLPKTSFLAPKVQKRLENPLSKGCQRGVGHPRRPAVEKPMGGFSGPVYSDQKNRPWVFLPPAAWGVRHPFDTPLRVGFQAFSGPLAPRNLFLAILGHIGECREEEMPAYLLYGKSASVLGVLHHAGNPVPAFGRCRWGGAGGSFAII